MQNPMLQELNQVNQRSSSNNNILAMFQNSNNPQELINNILSSNPQITNLINQYGHGDPKTAFYEYARSSGQDPQQVLNMIQKFIK